ncbi:hypothetical protein HYALB_00002437 [Hymenoscyphus albidus]|uniref:PrpF protein n=1 Tax=Hymenoscyphus albidus TaxID=595503 RepID=A0A9N9LVR9_9HELO|nr:hypothetical protein HYALB_00002437 [Hymenoscyphus albidus]
MSKALRFFSQHSNTLSTLPNLPIQAHLSRFYSSTPPRSQNRLPASYYRGGTSRAVIFHHSDLPQDLEQWAHIFRGVIGPPDHNGRQLDGLGWGISSLSKVCVVGPPSHADADVDYTFAAIGVRNYDVDYSSNCGNMTSAIGPFAVDSGMLKGKQDGEVTVRIHNTNTKKLIHATFPVIAGEAAASGNFAIDGVEGTAARLELAFIDPAGSKTGKLLPTGNIIDIIEDVETTCIDCGNPAVFLEADSIDIDGTILPDEIDAHPTLLTRLESIRRKASVAMGLSVDEQSAPASIPKIAIVSRAKTHKLLSGKTNEVRSMDLIVRALSVGQPHRAIPITVALATAAANLGGSVVQRNTSSQRVDEAGINIGHPTGKIMVGARFSADGGLEYATIFRTARRLMDGWIYWKWKWDLWRPKTSGIL